MAETKLLAGSAADVDMVKALIDQAVALKPSWGRGTLLHRLTGSHDLEQRMENGRVSARTLAQAAKALRKFIADQGEG